MNAPTIAQLENDLGVKIALNSAWIDSMAGDPAQRHEEGGWIFMDTTTGQLLFRRASSGRQAVIDLGFPPLVANSVVVATFHTHPNPSNER